MHQIWKFQLPRGPGRYTIEMPWGSQPISVQMQNDTLCVWATVDPELSKSVRTFRVVGTGQSFDRISVGFYIGTVQDGPLVWHVFMER